MINENVIEVTGMVIKSMPVGETDRRITLLTKERGKVAFFAHGARRTRNSFMGVTRLFAYGTFRLYENRDSFSLQSAEITNYFDTIPSDVETSCYGMYFLELADYYAHELQNEPQLLKLLYLSLTALTRPSIPHSLTRRIYELRIMVIDGAYDPEPQKTAGEACRYAWHFICTSPLEKLYTFNLKEDVMEELSRNVDFTLSRYVDRPIHSLQILKDMQ
jgi:DNA repair protein RecO (recombination protein O)